MELPGQGAGSIGFVGRAELPPALPKGLEVELGVLGGLLVEVRAEESRYAEEKGFAGEVGALVPQLPSLDPLAQQVHGELVGP
jgi:hypothetical protein